VNWALKWSVKWAINNQLTPTIVFNGYFRRPESWKVEKWENLIEVIMSHRKLERRLKDEAEQSIITIVLNY